MCPRVLLFLLGAAFVSSQVFAEGKSPVAVEDVYVAELMVESNVTLNAQTILSALDTTTNLEVSDSDGFSHTVTLSHSELVAECLILGDETTCNCNSGFIWSNEVCYNYSCCDESPCKQNVSDITPLCVAKVKVHINGSVTLNIPGTWDNTKTVTLQKDFRKLNGFEYLDVTGLRLEMQVADFEAAVSIRFRTSTLQDIVTGLETKLGGVLRVDTAGMVTMEAPETTVCYNSNPVLKCTFEEQTGSVGWNMSRKHERFELNTGSVVQLNLSCTSPAHPSCVQVTLKNVTGSWSGLYECGFTSGSVRHTARAQLRVALLPEEIVLKADPLTADCSEKLSTESVPVKVSATVLNSTESYEVWWSYNGVRKSELDITYDENLLVYTFDVSVTCQEKKDAHVVSVTFKNIKEQEETENLVIPVIYKGAKFCSEDLRDGWPKTPAGDTVINRTCPEGRVGYRSRTCEGPAWQDVFFSCVDQELNKVLNAADNFLKGLGATQEVAKDIFGGLNNRSTYDPDSSDLIADISASINVLNVMASASTNIALQDDVFPDFVHAASNMLNKTWKTNDSTRYEMSATYLQSVEDLVKNIKVNKSNGVDSENVDLKFCSGRDCKVSAFDIAVNLSMTHGIIKTVAVRKLMDKLRNNFHDSISTSLIISATLEDNNDSSIEIRLEFPRDPRYHTKPFCVFWNTTERDWSDKGCKATHGNRTICECNHLTSFSVLMSKGNISNPILDIITNVGLGVSIGSLLIFLLVESLVWSAVVKSNLSHFRHTAIVNIAVFLLLANCCFLASTSPESLGEPWCRVLTVCKHLFFLVMFSWMLCLSVMLVHQLIFVFSPLRKRVFMFFSSIVGYVCPILIVGSSYVYCKYTDKPYHREDTCWLVYVRLLEGSMHAFLLPVGVVILTNLFSMVVVIFTLMKSSAPEGSKTDDKETAKSIIKVVVFLTPVFGVTWIFGFAQLLLDEEDPLSEVVEYSFTILNSFQGFFILLTGCFAEQKVREEMVKLIMEKAKGKSDSTKNLISTTYTKDK